ncbi:hypothetical protein FBQ73_01285 [Xanthobacter autotrophicus]|uniref:Uncharacterized protein n=1 Tax=Xanthobacter autotrophicus TaxID=280 RepID=A0A6C1KLL8_XANAU|nr:hypothetical protein FBQ73_01285 [Xanthobacter autotrophicus]
MAHRPASPWMIWRRRNLRPSPLSPRLLPCRRSRPASGSRRPRATPRFRRRPSRRPKPPIPCWRRAASGCSAGPSRSSPSLP